MASLTIRAANYPHRRPREQAAGIFHSQRPLSKHRGSERNHRALQCGYLGDYVLVPNLDGPLVILDKENKVVSVIEVGKLLGGQGFKHPHDAIWLENGDIVVCTWNPGRLGYWRKLPKD